jgi:hypothetical protein
LDLCSLDKGLHEMVASQKNWTVENTSIFVGLVKEGLSYSDISEKMTAMGYEFVTRNAAIGKARRMQLHKDNAPQSGPKVYHSPKRTEYLATRKSRGPCKRNLDKPQSLPNPNHSNLLPVKSESIFVAPSPIIAKDNETSLPTLEDLANSLHLSWDELEADHCRFAYACEGGTDESKTEYCGKKIMHRSAYCPTHHNLVYVPPKRKTIPVPMHANRGGNVVWRS